jgi:hypothetical protein
MKAAVIGMVLTATQIGWLSDDTYTLYRNGVGDPNMRLHVASFDTADGEAYNRENCDIAAKLFQQQDGVTTRFWCEKGKFKK